MLCANLFCIYLEPGKCGMFVYLDETEFGEGAFSGYASLITEERIGQEVID